MRFSPEQLLPILADYRAGALRVAYSGGLDSHVLLHALVALRRELGVPIRAVHVNHGLSPEADGWARHCQSVCRELELELHCLVIRERPAAGESTEAWARRRRYALFERLLEPDEVLLTAHHADDQAETLLLQLLRGGGPHGLAAMPALRELGRGRHGRPLLVWQRPDLRDYARANGLVWIEDPSNRDPRFDRNYLRNRVMPVLRQHWPAATATLGRAAELQAETAELLAQLGELDLDHCGTATQDTLDIDCMLTLPPARQRNLVRHWLRRKGFDVPDRRRLRAILEELVPARQDAEPCVTWAGVEVRRYRGRLYALASLPAPAAPGALPWDPSEPLSLPLGTLSAETVTGAGIRTDACRDGTLRVGFRAGGERIEWPGGGHRQLKKLFQEHAVPAWLRRYVPLLYIDDELAAVAGVWVAAGCAAGAGEPGLRIHWSEAEQVFGAHE